MDTYLQTFAGVTVSLILFLIGYRQTIGAKKERVRAANSDIEKTLLRRVALESYKPSLNDIIRLIDGKARDYNVRTSDLLSPLEVLNTLFIRIVESDFVTPDQRKKVLELLEPVLSAAEGKPPEKAEVMLSIEPSRIARNARLRTLMVLAVLTSLIGVLVTLPIFKKDGTTLEYSLLDIWTFMFSILVITLFIVLQKIKESQEEEPSVGVSLESAIEFENEVIKTFEKLGLKWKFITGTRDTGFDFLLEQNGKKVLIELKAWARRPPIDLIQRAVNQLQVALKSMGADEAIILTNKDIWLPQDYFEGTKVKIMSLKQFRDYLVHAKLSR